MNNKQIINDETLNGSMQFGHRHLGIFLLFMSLQLPSLRIVAKLSQGWIWLIVPLVFIASAYFFTWCASYL
jgi:hypothetical protein